MRLLDSTPCHVSGDTDTIVALSTPSGTGAIGVVRLSGPRALELGHRVFRPGPRARDPFAFEESHRLVYGHVADGQGAVLDEVLLVAMRAPATYTREDIVEIHCHGGPAAQRAVLRLLGGLGARPAEPGEFTRRAYLNGRIDLAQAEGVAGVVQARTEVALRAAVRQLEGGLSAVLREVRRTLVGTLARVEATVDFADEDLDDLDRELVARELEPVRLALDRLLATALLGRYLEQGVRTAIVGRPNVGKSSLLNALLMRERAIVSTFPGTTRDTVEELTEIGGIPLHLVDTAGLRASDDAVERLGIERSRRALEEADLVLAVFDGSQDLEEEDRLLLAELPQGRTLLVANKRDLVADGGPTGCGDDPFLAGLDRAGWRGSAPDDHHDGALLVSARTGLGLDELRKAITEAVLGEGGLALEEPLVATERQRLLVEDARGAVAAAWEGARRGAGEELIAEDLRSAIRALGRITGEELVPDLVDEIFRRFCIGK